MHYFGMSYKEIVYEMPYRTVIMLSASVPRYKKEEDKNPQGGMHLGDILGTQLGDNDTIQG